MSKAIAAVGVAGAAFLLASCKPALRVDEVSVEPIRVEVPVHTLQFDLICHVTRQFDLRNADYPDARPYRLPNVRNDVIHRIIDLERMVYCFSNSCGGSKHTPIEAVTPEGIMFARYPDLVTFYRWDTGLSESRSTYEGRTSVRQGQCRIEPFSGFPAPRPGPIYLRERVGTGPHPFRHEGIHPDDEVVGGDVPGEKTDSVERMPAN